MKVENDMDYKIIADSCCDLTDEMKDWGNLALVPLTLELGDYRIMDDENFDQDDFIARMQALGDVPRSACPSPDAFCAAIAADDAKEVYVLTITDKLSGCYNSALQGVMLYEDDHPGEKKIHVFNSLATSGLETLIAYEIRRLKDSGLPFEQVVEQVEDYIHNHTALYFCLESLDALKNNGRLFSLAATVIKKLKMKLICQRSSEGTISLAGQDFAAGRAITKMCDLIAKDVEGKDLSRRTLIISMCAAPRKQIRLPTKYARSAALATLLF